VKDGRMPPKRINARTIWDIRRLDDAFYALSSDEDEAQDPFARAGPKAQLMVDLRLKCVVEDVDRHGNVRVYFRRPGFAEIRLRGLPGSEQFQFAYQVRRGLRRPQRIAA
jgi:hypothetical protein